MLKTLITAATATTVGFLFFFTACSNNAPQFKGNDTTLTKGNEEMVKQGEHLVTIAACHDCHTPKKMTPKGPVLDTSLWLSGHPSHLPPPDINRKETESKGLIITNDLTAWAGPWGISFTANLTPDSTGIGFWKEEQFIYAIRQGKLKGLPNSRPLLPPMPWEVYRHMTDDELKAIFAYLKSIKPIKNVVPPPVPPAGK
ncbi:MAG: c-type cytochrome [Flavisolibacter sp.]|nr:c-type cytochrome [Flavisolibacter sp.]